MFGKRGGQTVEGVTVLSTSVNNPQNSDFTEVSVNYEDCQSKADKIFSEYPNLVNCSLGSVDSLTIPMRIDTKNNSPVFSKVRPLHGKKREQIEAELNKWLNEGIITPVTEEVRWASPIHAVPKQDGSWRVCGDFKLLNSLTSFDKYPLPNLRNFNSKMAGCKLFSKIDLKRAYHQIPIVEEDQIKTTINTTLGLFKFLRIPFGLKNAGAVFQRNIDLILRPLSAFVFIYMDDVVVFSRTCDDHLKHLQKLFQVLSNHNILVNKEKCFFS